MADSNRRQGGGHKYKKGETYPNRVSCKTPQATNETLCDLPTFKDKHPCFIDTSPEESTQPALLIEPAKCPYDGYVSYDPLYNVTVCRNKRYYLNACSNKNPIQLISVRYVKCTCTCDACKTLHVPDACVPHDVFKKVSEQCHGKASCRVKLPSGSCEFEYKTAIRITYRCHVPNQKHEEREA
ncbi:uncharacterized protein LOC144637626 [Oculina patagonica]